MLKYQVCSQLHITTRILQEHNKNNLITRIKIMKLTGYTHPIVFKEIKELEEKGYIKREVSKKDNKTKIITPTRKLINELEPYLILAHRFSAFKHETWRRK